MSNFFYQETKTSKGRYIHTYY